MSRISKYIIMIFLLAPAAIFAVDSKALFEQGMEAFKSGNYGSSELLFRKIIEEDDEYRDRAWYHLALSIYNQKEYKSAIFEFNRFLTICTTAEFCSLSRYWIAESRFFLKDYTAAIEDYKRFMGESKDDAYIAFSYDRIGRIYFIQARYEEAVIEWMKALGRDKDEGRNNRRRLNVGEAQFYNEKYDEAIDILKTLLLPGVDERVMAKARLFTGMIYQKRGKDWQALAVFKSIPDSLLKEDPFFNVQYYRAMSYLAMGNTASAKEYFESFLLIAQNSDLLYAARFELGKMLIGEGSREKAVLLLNDVRTKALRPELKCRAAMILGKLYFDGEQYDSAVTYLEEASMSENPQEKKEAMLLLSNAYMRLKKYPEAESTLSQLSEAYSWDKGADNIQFLLGRLYLEKGEIDKAIENFGKIREIDAFSKYLDESYYYLGLAYMNNDKKEKAIESFNKYLSCKSPENVYDAYVSLLDIYIDIKNFKKADNIINIVRRYYLDRKGVEEVLYWYGKALRNNGLSEGPYFNLIISRFFQSDAAGKVLIQWGDEAFVNNDFRKAEKYYRNYLGVPGRQNESSVFLYRIICLYKLQKYNDVIYILKGTTPPVDDYTSKQLTLWLGRTYYQTGDMEQTYNTMYRWRLTDYSVEDIVIISKCAIKIGDVITVQEASVLLQSEKKYYAELLYDLGMYYNKKDDPESALVNFLKIINESPATEFADRARAETAGLYIKTENYIEAMAQAREIKDAGLQDRKNAMLIICYFGTGDYKNATAMSDKYYDKILRQQSGEAVMRFNLKYHYDNKNLMEFNKYATGLGQYGGNRIYINYMSGKLNYELGIYKTAYYSFYKVINTENEYLDESLYHLGVISILADKNPKRAQWYFKKLADKSTDTGEFAMKGRMALSVIAREKGDNVLSGSLLKEIINAGGDRLLKIQAENLYEYYGFTQ